MAGVNVPVCCLNIPPWIKHLGVIISMLRSMAGEGKAMTDKYKNWGTWVPQLIKHPALDFSSGHDLSVPEIEL